MFGRVFKASLQDKIIFYLILGGAGILAIYPFFFLVTTSLKDSP